MIDHAFTENRDSLIGFILVVMYPDASNLSRAMSTGAYAAAANLTDFLMPLITDAAADAVAAHVSESHGYTD